MRLAHQLDSELLNNATNLRYIVSPTTGLNHIDLNECNKRNINVLSLKGETEFLDNIYATAEHTWALLLTLVRKIPQAVNSVCDNQWNRDSYKGHELHGKTIGVIGLGRIGRKIVKYAEAFEMRILATDIVENKKMCNVQMVSLNDLLRESDVVSLHADYNSNNHSFLTHEHFKIMKRSSLFINTARGELVDERALLDALKNGLIAGAAIDVIANETNGGLTDNKMIKYANYQSNLIITPHIGGATYESMQKTEIFMANKLKSIINMEISRK